MHMTTVNTEHDMNMIAALLNIKHNTGQEGGDMHCHLPASRPCTPDNLLNRLQAGINTINHHGMICGKKWPYCNLMQHFLPLILGTRSIFCSVCVTNLHTNLATENEMGILKMSVCTRDCKYLTTCDHHLGVTLSECLGRPQSRYYCSILCRSRCGDGDLT